MPPILRHLAALDPPRPQVGFDTGRDFARTRKGGTEEYRPTLDFIETLIRRVTLDAQSMTVHRELL